MAPNPMSSRCTAHSKSNGGERCQHRVIGGGVCYVHGGNASQVKAAREARVITLRAQLAAGEREPQPARHPAEVLLSAIDDSDQIMSQLRRDFAAGLLSPELHRAYGDAIDRAARTSKMALDVSATERLIASQQGIARDHAARLIAVMDRCMADPRVIVSCDPRLVVADAIKDLGFSAHKPAELQAVPS
jgi:hypothetical protein